MKFKIEINYEDKKDDASKQDFQLDVKSEFCDDSAKLVVEVLEHFTQKLAEHKNGVRYIQSSKL